MTDDSNEPASVPAAGLTVMLVTGGVVGLNPPPNFNFPECIRALHADGFLMAPGIYIARPAIAAIFYNIAPPMKPGVEGGRLQ